MENNEFELNGYVFNLKARAIRKAQSKVSQEGVEGIDGNELMMFYLLKSGQSREVYEDFLECLNDDDYSKLVSLPINRFKELGESMAVYTQPQLKQD